MVTHYSKTTAFQIEEKHSRSDRLNHGITLAELLAYIDEASMNEGFSPVFKLSVSFSVRATWGRAASPPHSTKLKNHILAQI